MLVSENPIRKMPTFPKVLDIPRPANLKTIISLWKQLEINKNNCKNNQLQNLVSHRNIIIFFLIYGAGLKVSELEKVKMDHLFIDQDHLRLLVNRKYDQIVTIDMSNEYISFFETYLKLLKQYQSDHFKFDELLFNANQYKVLSGSLSARGIEILFKELSKSLENNVTPKSLRQSCIFKWLNENRSHSLIKEWMGVSPSYSLKNFIDLKSEYIFQDYFFKYQLDLGGRLPTGRSRS